MQKLSKELIKKLIYEAYQEKKKVSVKGDYKGELTDEEVEALEDEVGPDNVEITKESIDRIIREEVQAHYGAE
tara:strand:- start:611 stop:829 length:219 start_codon:yes stop_codon:yes gene_type:complete